MLILFGLAGAGKTYVGTILQKYFGFYLYDGDNDLTGEMKKALVEQRVFTDAMRDVFFHNLIQSIAGVKKNHVRLAVSQTCIKEKYRLQILQAFPEAQFILIASDEKIRRQRLTRRKQYSFEKNRAYVRIMDDNFETPQIPHSVIENNREGEEYIIEQLRAKADL